MKRYFALFALAALTALAQPACAPRRLYVRIDPPGPIVETRLVAPGPDYIWVPGFHRWDGHAYVWISGRWELPPRHYRVWVPGHWVRHRKHGWYWVDGHWRR